MSTIPPPTSPSDIITCLSLALSPSPQIRSSSLSSLQAWSTLPGYYTLLTRIFTERSGAVEDAVRLQALLQFKNGVDKYWRKMSNNAISAEEKSTIRPLLLTMIDEPNRILAKNLAVTIGKLARLDYGTDWNDLPSSLLHSLHTSTSLLTLHRSLLYLHSTLKSLSSNRTPKGRLYLKKLTELLFSDLVGLQRGLLERAVERLGKEGLQGGEGEDEVECCLLGGKGLRLLAIYGDVDPASNPLIKEYFVSTLPTFLSILQLRLQLLSSPQPVTTESTRLTYLTKHLVGYIKLWRSLIEYKNVEYFDRMGITQGVLEAAWGVVKESTLGVNDAGERERVADSSTALYPTRLLIPSLLLLKSTLSSWDGASPLSIPLAFIHSLTRCLIDSCLVLKKDELEKWDFDAEEFVNEEEENEGKWEFELRPASEIVLKSLVGGYKEEVGAILKGYLEEERIRNPKNMEDLLLKESLYTGIGKSLGELGEIIDFESWLRNSLIPEALSTDTNYRLIRRRISSLLGSLLSSDPSPTSLPLIYELLTHLLSRNASTDPAIRLTSVKSLQKADTWDFNLQSFLPFLERIVGELVELLGSVELAETRMRVMSALGIVVARVEGNIEPYASQLVEMMGRLWVLSGSNQPHFQTSILVTLTRLSEALGEKSQSLHSSSCPIIQFSVDSTLPSHIYLQEDALELWSVLLKRSSSLTQEMLALLPILVGLIGEATDLLPKLFSIFESYLLLNSHQVLELCAFEFFRVVGGLMEGLTLEATKVVLHAVNMVFKCTSSSSSGGREGVKGWAEALDQSQVFVRLLEGVGKPDTSALVVTKYLCSIARIILASPSVFHSLLTSTSVRLQTSSDSLLSLILNQFIERLDNMSQGGQRKIVALAVAELVVTNNPIVLSRLPDLVALWSGVLAQTEETQEGDAELYHVTDDYTSEVEYDYTETPETSRKSTLTASDPMITSKLSTFIGERLTRAQELNGGSEEFSRMWLSQVDPIVVEELVKRLEGRLKG